MYGGETGDFVCKQMHVTPTTQTKQIFSISPWADEYDGTVGSDGIIGLFNLRLPSPSTVYWPHWNLIVLFHQ